MKKRGRPLKDKDEKVTEKISILLTTEEKEKLQELADKNGLTISNCVREIIHIIFEIKK